MNKRISSPLAFALIIVVAFAVADYFLKKANSVDFFTYTYSKPLARAQEIKKNICKNRVFRGSAEIRVWQKSQDEKTPLMIASEDSGKFPTGNVKNLKLIDQTPELEKKLAVSSEKKPVKISISGLAALCDGALLASLNYKDGIFRPYIVN